MSSEGSDIELQSALPKKSTKKMPRSPSEDILKKKPQKKIKLLENEDSKKLSTKIMIHQALFDLKSRKGVSLQAIKKYLSEKYNADTEKINYIIKKSIKKAVEEGTIIQTKGIGASGSFKLVPVKEKKKPKPKKNKDEKEGKEKSKSLDKPKKMKEKLKKSSSEKVVKSKQKESKIENKTKILKKTISKEKVNNEKVEKGTEKTKKTKIAKAMQTPAKKKAAMMKRKSIGSIIKPPKMKPRAKE